MDAKIKYTVAEWDALEAEKRAALQVLTTKLSGLNVKRGEMLLLIADGEDKEAKKEIAAIEKEQKDIALEVESIQSLLIAIPKRRDMARADDIESTITQVESFDLRLAELAVKIDAAAEGFVLAVREYYDTLEALYKINVQSFAFLSYDIGAINAIGALLRKHGIWKYIKVGVFRDAQLMTEAPNRARYSIAAVLNTMRDHAKELRGIGSLNKDVCRECYGHLAFENYSKKYICNRCGSSSEE